MLASSVAVLVDDDEQKVAHELVGVAEQLAERGLLRAMIDLGVSSSARSSGTERAASTKSPSCSATAEMRFFSFAASKSARA